MHDVFLSYAAADRETARVLAETLTTRGLRVWWDRDIAPGATWADKIETALKSAACVIVLWTEASVGSKWVRKEARYAESHSKLVPAFVQDVEIPFEFEHVQSADLTGWNGVPDHPGVAALVDVVTAVIRKDAPGPVSPRPRANWWYVWRYSLASGSAGVAAVSWAAFSGFSEGLERFAVPAMILATLTAAGLASWWFLPHRRARSAAGPHARLVVRRLSEALLPLCAALFVTGAAAQLNKPDQTTWTKRDIALAERFLQSIHRRDGKTSYELAAQSVRDTVSLAVLDEMNRHYMLQFTAPPVTRTYEKGVIVNGVLVLAFLSEFDAVTTLREFVQLVWQPDGWRPARYDIWPTEWPVTGYQNHVLTESKAGEILSVLAAAPPDDRAALAQRRFAGKYVASTTGWALKLDGPRLRVAERTCNVMATEQDTGAKVMLWGVLDGCGLSANLVVHAFGRVRVASAQRVDLEAVRVVGQ